MRPNHGDIERFLRCEMASVPGCREDDDDDDLLIDWRAGEGAIKPAPVQQRLPFKQRKTMPGDVTKAKQGTAAAAASTAVVYDLSDSEDTPEIPRKVSISPGARSLPSVITKAPGALRHSSRKLADAEVVDLGSDSDEDVSSSARLKGFPDGKNSQTEPSVAFARGTIEKGSYPVGDKEMPGSVSRYQIEEKADVSKSSTYTFNLGEDIRDNYILGTLRKNPKSNQPFSGIHSSGEAVNVGKCPIGVDTKLKDCWQLPKKCVEDISAPQVDGTIEDLTEDGCDSELECLGDGVRCGSRKSGATGDNLKSHEWLRDALPTFFDASEERKEGRVGKKNTMDVGNSNYSAPDVGQSFFIYNDYAPSAEMPKRKYAKSNDGFPILSTTETLQSTRLHDISNLESSARANHKKPSKGRKCSPSEAELAEREAEKQRERELKKARQEEEKRLREEKKEELKKQKEAAKVEAAERRKVEKESVRWMKGRFALKNTTAFLDSAVVEMKNLGPLILGQLGGKGYNYKILSNPIKRSIIWKMKRPVAGSAVDSEGLGSQADSEIGSQVSNSQLVLEDVEIKYVVIVFQGEEFSRMVADETLHRHLLGVQREHPEYAVSYLVNGLKKYLNREDQHHFKTGAGNWKRPNVEQALAELITHYKGVNSRLCIDESEIADHVVGLMRSLAECPFKQKLTSISVQANGDHVTKSDPNKSILKKSTWLKALVAIPHISGAIAIAVAKVYPTMRALLNVYLDTSKTSLEKEFLLQDIVKDAVLGAARLEGRRVGPIASKRIYRVLMAQDGNLIAADAEDGADHFTDLN